MSEETHDPELSALEAALRGLTPTPAAIDRDRLLFRAGAESARRPRYFWPLATAASLVLAASQFLFLAMRAPTERVVYVQVEKAPSPVKVPEIPWTPAPALEQTAYLQLRRQILEKGVDSLPAPLPVPFTPPSLNYLDLL